MANAKAGKLNAAANAFSTGHKLYPTDPRFLTELAGVEYLRKNTAAAKHWLLDAVKLVPDDAYANEFLGTLYQIDGNLKATLKYWNRVNKPFLASVTFPSSAGLNAAFRDRMFLFSAGQVFTLRRLRESEANLRRADVLASSRIDLLTVLASRDYQAVVDTQPLALPLKGWLGQFLPMLRELPYQGVDFDRYDIAGRGMNLTSLWRWDPDKRRINIEWRAPVRGNPRSEYRLWTDDRDEIWSVAAIPGLKVHSATLGGEFITGLTDKLQWTLGGTLSRHTYAGAETDIWQAMINNRFDYNLWEIPEHRLSFVAWGLFDAGRTFSSGSGSRLIETRGGLSGEWFPQSKGETYRLNWQAQAGRLFGTVPVDELFQLGMERDNDRDLWLRGVLSARDGRKGTGLLGREYAITQTIFERRFFHVPFVTFSAGPFFDAGRAWNEEFGIKTPRVSYDAGLQIEVKTLGGVGLTVVYGRDLMSGRGAFYTAVSR